MGETLPSRLGPIGLSGIGVFLFCASLYAGTLLPLQDEAAHLAEDIAVLERQAQKKTSIAAAPSPAPGLHVRPLHEVPAFIERLLALAETCGISLDRPEYKVSQRAHSHLHDYELNLAVRGTYAQIRQFIVSLADPAQNIALEGMDLQRARATDAVIDAHLRISAAFEAKS